jgi:hypothetical protein
MSLKIHLHIDHLSLPGYTPADRRAFIAALERELASRSAAGTLSSAQAGSQKIIRTSAPDLRPESVARNTVSSLNLSTKRGAGQP